jgi:hypothetical protein
VNSFDNAHIGLMYVHLPVGVHVSNQNRWSYFDEISYADHSKHLCLKCLQSIIKKWQTWELMKLSDASTT